MMEAIARRRCLSGAAIRRSHLHPVYTVYPCWHYAYLFVCQKDTRLGFVSGSIPGGMTELVE